MSACGSLTLERVQDTLRMIDGFATDTFSRIEAMANIALIAFENPEGLKPGRLMEIASILESIAVQASTTINDISCEAEALGCSFDNERRERRLAAICKRQPSSHAEAAS